MDNNRMGRISEIGIEVVSVIMLVGICTWFAPCGPMEDGSWMTCHWAGQAVKAMAVVSVLLAALHIVIKDDNFKAGIDCALAAIGITTALVPGHIIGLCMMEDMTCRRHTQPWTIGLSIILLLCALADAFYRYSKIKSATHQRAVA